MNKAKIITTDKGWVINPGSNFLLTIYNTDKETAERLKDLLDNEYPANLKIEELMIKSNFKCLEIDEYIEKYKPIFDKKLKEKISLSSEWTDAGEKDKEDLLFEFRKQVTKDLDVRPNCDVEILFKEPPKINEIQSLITKYGYEILNLYISNFYNVGKVYTQHADSFYRETFENFWKLGLVVRGKEISLKDMLSGLKLKEMNEIVKDLVEKPFRKKDKAIEFMESIDDISKRLGKYIAMRSLFQIAPPDDILTIGEDRFREFFEYYMVIAELIYETYHSGIRGAELLNAAEYVKEWKVISTSDNEPCPCCKALINKSYPKTSPPKPPFHIGCACNVDLIYDDD